METRPQPVVREEDCVGCRLCYNVCPVDDCIRDGRAAFRARAGDLERAIARSRPQVTEDWEAMKDYREQVGIHIH